MTKLEEILAHKRRELAEIKQIRPLRQVERELKSRPPTRDFRRAICRPGSLSLIAEVKRASPSAGPIRPGADASGVAKAYAGAGAQAVSVLTDSRFFSGSLEDLSSIKQAVPLPVLRKDFLLEEYSVVEAAAAGADALLLISAALPAEPLKRLLSLTRDLGMEGLVEVHTEEEIARALGAGASLLGINNRDLATFEVDLKTTQRLIRRIPRGSAAAVSESGIRSRADVEFVGRCGANAILVGEELMASGDPAARIKELMGWVSRVPG